jgi:hypothetical protein
MGAALMLAFLVNADMAPAITRPLHLPATSLLSTMKPESLVSVCQGDNFGALYALSLCNVSKILVETLAEVNGAFESASSTVLADSGGLPVAMLGGLSRKSQRRGAVYIKILACDYIDGQDRHGGS